MKQFRSIFHSLRNGVQAVLFFSLGVFIVLPCILLFVIITIPAIIYRSFVTKILPRTSFCPTGITKPLSLGFGTAYAAEFMKCSTIQPPRPSRNVIVQETFMSGIIPAKECLEMVKRRWVDGEKSTSSSKYPELKQHVVSWMGHLFWKENHDFQLENHLKFHNPLALSENIDNYCKQLMEDLLNKPFDLRQSPWEIHIVQSCSCRGDQPQIITDEPLNANNNRGRQGRHGASFCSTCGKEELTVFVTRIHHCLGDGISFMFALLDGLFGADLSHITKAIQGNKEKAGNKDRKMALLSTCKQAILPFTAFFRLCHEFGCVASFILWRVNSRTELHIPDHKKTWQQFYERSQYFPLHRMKLIKNHYGVSFSAVVLSCVSAALSKYLFRPGSPKADAQEVKNFLLCMVIPLPGHPIDRWINYITGTAYNMPLKANMDPVERLIACQKVMKQVNQSLFAQMMFPLLVKLQSCYITPIVRFGFYNKWFGAAISNFSVSDYEDLICNGKYPIVKADATSGGNDGLTGIFIQTLGFRDEFRFMGTADGAVMKRQELKSFLEDLVRETETLLERTKNCGEFCLTKDVEL